MSALTFAEAVVPATVDPYKAGDRVINRYDQVGTVVWVRRGSFGVAFDNGGSSSGPESHRPYRLVPVVEAEMESASDEKATTDSAQLAESIVGLSFHVDDVPVFDHADAVEALRDVLGRFGWVPFGTSSVAWGDSSTPVEFLVTVGPFSSVYVDELEGARVLLRRTLFGGEYRVSVPRALWFVASLQGSR